MTSIAWPTEQEWECWFYGEVDKAIYLYLSDGFRRHLGYGSVPEGLPRDVVEQTFRDCLNIPAKMVVDGSRVRPTPRPEQRYHLRRYLWLLESLERKFSFKLDR